MNEHLSEKRVWDEKDFEFMAWRDTQVHAMAFSPEDHEFALDIDYIAKRLAPTEGQHHAAFLVAPASMYFENASSIQINVMIDSAYELTISEIKQTYIRRTPSDKYEVWRYEIEFHRSGNIKLEASGFKLFLRRAAVHTATQQLSLKERGGVSFGRERIAT